MVRAVDSDTEEFFQEPQNIEEEGGEVGIAEWHTTMVLEDLPQQARNELKNEDSRLFKARIRLENPQGVLCYQALACLAQVSLERSAQMRNSAEKRKPLAFYRSHQ